MLVEGKKSKTADVTSGVPQGSVIGPLLFLVYINDMPGYVRSSSMGLFADDSMVGRTITSKSDAELLQQDLNRLQEWERIWQMEFNPDKCEVITVTNKRSPIHFDYTIHGKVLKHVPNAKYLGVTINQKLSWSTHISNVTKNANGTRAFFSRNTHKCPQHVKARCYQAFIRPILEYASVVWDPHTKKDIQALESVQRRAARYVCSDYGRTSSVTAMLNRLGWPNLQQRRRDAKAVMTYRIVNNLVASPSETFLIKGVNQTRGHGIRFLQPHTRVQAYQYSFFPSAVTIWNSLPASLVSAPTLDAFKNGLVAATRLM